MAADRPDCAAARAAITASLAARPWAELLELASERGKERDKAVRAAAGERAAELGKGRDATRIRRDGEEAGKRADRRARTEAIDRRAPPAHLGLARPDPRDLHGLGVELDQHRARR